MLGQPQQRGEDFAAQVLLAGLWGGVEVGGGGEEGFHYVGEIAVC